MMNYVLYDCSFLETNVPLLVLIEAAKAGNEKEVEEYALVFTEHANKLVEVNIVLTFSLKISRLV
jgi:catenin alpha